MIIPIPATVRTSLSWLDFSPEELTALKIMEGLALNVSKYGGNQDIASGIRKCWENYRIITPTVGPDWFDFLTTKVLSSEEFFFLMSDDYDFFRDSQLSPSIRFAFIARQICDGIIAPVEMRNLWARQLASHGGDYLAAEVSLEFLRPKGIR